MEAAATGQFNGVYRIGVTGAQAAALLENTNGSISVNGDDLVAYGPFEFRLKPRLKVAHGGRYEVVLKDLLLGAGQSISFNMRDVLNGFGWRFGWGIDSFSWGIQFPAPPGGAGSGAAFTNSDPSVMRVGLSKPSFGSLLTAHKDTINEGDEGLSISRHDSGAEVVQSRRFENGQLEVQGLGGLSVSAKIASIVGWEQSEDHPTAVLLPLDWVIDSHSESPYATNAGSLPRVLTPWQPLPAEPYPLLGHEFNGANRDEYTLDYGQIIGIDVAPGALNILKRIGFTQVTRLDEAGGTELEVAAALNVVNPSCYDYDEVRNFHWIGDANQNRIVAVQGVSEVRQITSLNGSFKPTRFIVDAQGERIYVADNSRGMVFCADLNGNLIWSYGKETNPLGPIQLPSRMALDRQRGLLYVSNQGMLGDEVVTMDASGYPIRVFPRSSSVRVELAPIIDLDVDQEGRLVIQRMDKRLWVNRNGDLFGGSANDLGSMTAISSNGVTWIVGNAASADAVLRLGPDSYANTPSIGTARLGKSIKDPKRKFLPDGKMLLVAPNPVRASARAGFWMEKEGRARLLVVNIAGELVRSQGYDGLEPGEHVVDLGVENLANGIYFVFFQSDFGEGYAKKASFKLAITK